MKKLAILLLAGMCLWPLAVLAGEEEEKKVPPPTSWKPAGEVTPPAETKAPSPMFSYGEFELSVHGRVQIMGGHVGEDAHVMNGDVLSRDGFRIRRARLGVEGQIAEQWEYGLELDLIDEDSGGNALLDAYITYKPCDFGWIQAGAGKLPWSRALIISSANLQLIERPAWVGVEAATGTNQLDLGRQVGLSMGGQVSLFNFSAGVYNGAPGYSVGDLNDGLLYVVRLGAGQGDMGKFEGDLERGGFRWAFGLNGYLNFAEAADVRGAGADLAVKFKGISFYAEAVWAKSIPDTRPEGINPELDETERWGMYAQAGYMLPFDFMDLELACRFAIMDDNVHLDNEGDLWELTAGLNGYFYDGNVKLMINYILKEEQEGADLANDSILAMLQLMF